ncbi:MAG TPA: RimK/LysX family protein [Thermodesulfobacteriota bacterium]|mgnify:CR=1 FL=1|nr:RimK/LysX family protein [Thermodesulfobacteriota bacterium]
MIIGKFRFYVSITLVIFFFFLFQQPSFSEQKVVVGWLEKVYIPRHDFSLRAKMDTGAKNSSLHAVDIEYVQAKGKPQGSKVRFKVIDTEGEYRIMEADVIGEAKVKRPRQETSMDKLTVDLETRPVVELEICLAGITKRIQVNLTNRSGMNYRFILGRSALTGDFVVDVTKKFIYGSGSRCRKIKKP